MAKHNNSLIRETETFVKEQLQNAEGGHDWWHIQRVRRNALHIASREGGDSLIVELGALLHDIADSKFHNGDEEIGPRFADEFLSSQKVEDGIRAAVVHIVRSVSFKGAHNAPSEHSLELDIVQDADRLDALGAIGIARTFNFGGFKNRPLYDPDVPPNPNMTKAEYKKGDSPTINHFYEKLLLLKDRMNTKTGRAMAEERHAFMEEFLEQFYREWG